MTIQTDLEVPLGSQQLRAQFELGPNASPSRIIGAISSFRDVLNIEIYVARLSRLLFVIEGEFSRMSFESRDRTAPSAQWIATQISELGLAEAVSANQLRNQLSAYSTTWDADVRAAIARGLLDEVSPLARESESSWRLSYVQYENPLVLIAFLIGGSAGGFKAAKTLLDALKTLEEYRELRDKRKERGSEPDVSHQSVAAAAEEADLRRKVAEADLAELRLLRERRLPSSNDPALLQHDAVVDRLVSKGNEAIPITDLAAQASINIAFQAEVPEGTILAGELSFALSELPPVTEVTG